MLAPRPVHPLAVRRHALGITQERLAQYLGMDRGHLSRIESGQIDPYRSTKERLASALDCAVDVIFPKNESSPAARPSSTGAGRHGGS